MVRRGMTLMGMAAAAFVVTTAGAARPAADPIGVQGKPAAAPASAGWVLPPDADTTKNPLAADEKVLASGKALYRDKCQRCHGPGGIGDGPDADPDAREDMDLTNPKRADQNSDGIVFFKIMNGRRRPKMPAFKEELTADQVWSIVTYAQTLRKK